MKAKLRKTKPNKKTPKPREVRKALEDIEKMSLTYSQDCNSHYFILLLMHTFLISVDTKISKTNEALVFAKRKVYSVAKRRKE